MCLFRNINCKIINNEEVNRFIEENNLKECINKTLDIIFKYYSEEQKTSLELFIDEGFEKLFLNIILKDCSKENIKKFNEINNWFVDNIYKYNNNFNINLEFK